MENEEEAKAFAEEVKPTAEEEKPKKAKKSVNFNLDQNQVKEFDKTKKITEVPEDTQEPSPSTSEKKTIAQTNMDDMVNRTLKKKNSTTTEDIMKLSKSDSVTTALKKSL